MFWRGVWGYLPANLVQGLVGFASIAVFTRLLSPEEFGRYALAFSAMTVAHTAVFTWAEAAMARFWAAEHADPKRLSAHFATLYRSVFVLMAAFAAAVAVGLWLWPAAGPLKLALIAAFAAVPARTLAKLAQERRRAAGEVRSSANLDMGQSAGGFALGALFAVAGFGGAAPLLGLGLAALLCLPPVLPKELAFARGGTAEPGRARLYAAYGTPIAASLLLALALATVDRFLIATFLGEAEVGAYHAGYSLAHRTLDVIFIWLGAAGGPALVMALERGGRPALAEAAREQAGLMALLAFPAAAGIAVVAAPLAQVMIGPELAAQAAAVTPWIALSGLCAGLTTYFFHQAFTLGRRTGLLMLAMAVPALANLGLNLWLLPRYGLIGAAWATAASYALGLIASALLGRRCLPLPVPWTTAAKAALATAGMAGLVVLLPSRGGLSELLLKASAGGLTYAALAWMLDAGGVRARSSRLLNQLRAKGAA